MSKLQVNSIAKLDGTLEVLTDYVSRGSAKAWANLNGTGTAALRASFNVTSIVDNGTGDFSFNLTSAMSDANGALAMNCESTGGTSTNMTAIEKNATRTASLVRVLSGFPNTGGVSDLDRIGVVLMGSLA